MFRYACKIVRVVDGDTVDVDIDLGFGIWIHNERIRIHGIDAPESRTRDLEEKKCGILATEFVESMLKVGSTYTLVTEKVGDKGKFGRVLGKFEVYDHKTDSTMFLGDIMIRDHYAVAYPGESKEQIEEQHLINREKLRNLGLI